MPHISILALLLSLGALAHAEKPCTQPDLHAPAQRAKALQSQLLAAKVANQGTDDSVPLSLQLEIHALKDTLAALATVALECAPANTGSAALQTTLATALNLDKQQRLETTETSTEEADHIYGADLTVKVTRPTTLPILLIEFRFGIACGTDSLLLAYEYRHVHWLSAARWQSPDYDQVSGAFGDFFDYLILQPQGAPKPEETPPWFLAIAHGRPWCTSNMSAFHLDVLQPSEFQLAQHPVYHESAVYIRTTSPTFSPNPDGFELRLTANSLDASIAAHTAIYRYRVTPGSPEVSPVERIQPIADNGRDFVDEWLQAPWGEAKKWAAPEGLPSLEPIHKRIEALHDPAIKDFPVFEYGPVRPCADATTHYQVELRQASAGPAKPRPAPPTFFQIEEGKNAFTMLSASTQPNPHCTGADIMTAH